MNIAILLITLFLTDQLFSQEDNMTVGAKLKYSQAIDLHKKSDSSLQLNDWEHLIQGNIELDSHLGDHFFARVILSHQNLELTCEESYIKKAYLGFNFNKELSLRVGCMTTHQFGWDQKKYDLFSSVSSSFRNNLYRNKYKKSLELNLNLFGTFSTQILEDSLYKEKKEGQLALNFSWQHKFKMIEPLLQLSLSNNYKSISYTLGLQAELEQFLLRGDVSQQYEDKKNIMTPFNIALGYKFDGFFETNEKDLILLSFIGIAKKDENMSSESHLTYNLNFGESILSFADIGITPEENLMKINFGVKAIL